MMETGTRIRFGMEIEYLRERLVLMGSTADEMVTAAVEALLTQNAEVIETVINRDTAMDDLDREVEADALLMLATRQPVVGSDLRFVSATLKAITDLERIGDLAVNIARTAQRMAEDGIRYEAVTDLRRFGGIAQRMLRESMDAIVRHDSDLARDVIDSDDEADVMYREAQRELRRLMLEPTLTEDPNRPVRASYLLFVAHYLERICDHCTNIAERVIFAETGDVVVPIRSATNGAYTAR